MYNPGSFRRGGQSRKRAKIFLIITNGKVTENEYFTYLDKIAYDKIHVKTNGKGYSLDNMLADAIKARNEDGDYDFVSIVMDIDNYLSNKKEKTKLKKLLSEAHKNKVEVILSNESFEVWLCAHKTEISSKIQKREKAACVAVEIGMLGGSNNKHVNESEITKENVERAINEVARVRKQNRMRPVTDYKPSTDVDILVGRITLK